MLLQELAQNAAAHPLRGTAAEWVGLLPLIPLVGFAINGWLSISTAFRKGPSDPSLAHGEGHGEEPGHHAHEKGSVGHAEPAVHDHAAGDDHHPVARHRHAGIVSIVGPLVLAAAFALTLAIWLAMLGHGGSEVRAPFVKSYFSWMPVGDMKIDWAFQVDQLSMVMAMIITGVGTLIHIFSVGYMQDDPGYPRYFAYLNLFVAFMLVLVLGASYPVLFVGWEGVGLCSYLLIGFWFTEKANADAGKKAFIVNRIGDFGFLVAMFLMWSNFGRLDFQGVQQAVSGLPMGSVLLTTICLFLFLGCTGKSAQIPLYTWLPDAMAGPTPVSALIHAATMVTAGVYLVARSNFLFALAPAASLTVALVGAVTAIFAATIGLKQWDIKKVLAYSTVSQLGYMFVGVGVGAYASGIFHLATHAFFKALLFLGSGSVIFAMHAAYHHTGSHEDAQDMRNMGGLGRFMPFTRTLMWVATLAIAGVPFFAGFFSKDAILGATFERAREGSLAEARWLGIPGSTILYVVYALGLAAALLTAIYMTRMMIYTFHGPNRTGDAERDHLHEAPWVMTGPLMVLGLLSAFGGWLNIPEFFHFLGPVGVLDRWLDPVVGGGAQLIAGPEAAHPSLMMEAGLIGAAVAVGLIGIAFAFARLKPERLVPKAQSPEETGFDRVLEHKYYVDEAYDSAVVQPTVGFSRGVLWRGIDVGIIDGLFVNGSAYVARGIGWVGSQLQSGQVGTYAWAIVLGVIAIVGVITLR